MRRAIVFHNDEILTMCTEKAPRVFAFPRDSFIIFKYFVGIEFSEDTIK